MFVALLLLLYLLKKFITRKRYIPRAAAYIGAKRSAVERRYKVFITKVNEVNSTLALLLPHIFYFVACALLWSFARGLVKWVVDDLRGAALLGVIYPVFGSMEVIQRKIVLIEKQKGGDGLEEGGDDDDDDYVCLRSTPSSHGKSSQKRKGAQKKKKAGGKTQAAAKSQSKSGPGEATPPPATTSILQSPLTSPSSLLRVGGGKRKGSKESILSPHLGGDSSHQIVEDQFVDDDLAAAVRYWVVFGVASSVFQSLSLLPFLGRWVASFGFTFASGPFMLFFFLWLHMPMNATTLLYENLCPLALQVRGRLLARQAQRCPCYLFAQSVLTLLLRRGAP